MMHSLFRRLPDRLIRIARAARTMMGLYWTRSYAQEGEDIILRRIFEGQASGFYVDIGAHHPMRYSNTYYFYKRGWRGINVEPNPDSIRLFRRYRGSDINVHCGVSNQDGKLRYYMFNDPALNSFDENLSRARDADTYRITEIRDVTVRHLESIFDELLPRGVTVDFMSIDVEGLDLQVLQSNNWNLYRPRVLLIEALSFDLDAVKSEPIHRFLEKNGYHLFAKTVHTLFYRDTQPSGGSNDDQQAAHIKR